MLTDDVEYHRWYKGREVVVSKMPENAAAVVCPTCCQPFDKSKHRRLIDTCGHELCYTCINSDHCPLCLLHAQSQQRPSSEVSLPRPRLKTNGHFTAYMQVRERVSPERPPPPSHPPKVKPAVPPRTYSNYSPRVPRTSRSYRHLRWPNVLDSDSQVALSDDELQSSSISVSRDQNLYTRLGLLLGDRVQLTTPKNDQQSCASVSSLASSEANTTNTSPLSTLTDSSDMDPSSRVSGLRCGMRDQSSDSVVSLMSSSTGHSSCSSPIGYQFQRHALGRTSDSFVQIAKRNLSRRQMHHKSDESAIHFTAVGRKSSTSKLLNKILKPLYFEVPHTESEPLFLGRQWIFKEIEQELMSDGKGKRGIVIMGGPGSGKTAIVSQLIEHSSFHVKKDDAIYQDIQSLDGSDYNMSNSSSSDSGVYQSISSLHYSASRSLGSRLVAYHLCQTDNHVTCLVPEFVHSIAAHLCRAPQLTAYRDSVARDQKLQDLLSLQSCIAKPDTAFVEGILKPLANLRARNRIPNATCLLVVDGLNEAEYHKPEYGDTITSFLAKHFEHVPVWLKVIVTIRSSFFERIKKLPSHCIFLDKVHSNENIQKDICTNVMHRINTSPAIRANITVNNSKVEGSCTSKFASHLASLSKGCMLYVRLTLDLIEKGHLVVKSSSYRVLPVSLSEVYMLIFNLKFTTTKSYERVLHLLQICLATLRPLTLQELFNTLNARCVSQGVSWDDFMGLLDTLTCGHMLVTRQDGTVMFVHPSMREWLMRRDEGESNKFLCDSRFGHAAIAFRMSRTEEADTPDGCLELGHHILRAHIYKNASKDLPLHPRDIQAHWVFLGCSNVQGALASLRNAYCPNVKVSRLLLLSGASPHCIIQSQDNLSALAIAAKEGYLEMVSLLLEFGANANVLSSNGVGALALACQKGSLDVVSLLLSRGARINAVDHDGKCPIVYAAANGHLDVVMHLLQYEFPPNGPSIYQSAQWALVAASYKGHHNILEHLLDTTYCQVDEISSLCGQSALSAACHSGHLHCCNVLLRRGAQMSAVNQMGEPPLLLAASQGHWEVAEKLLMHGASFEQKDGIGRTALVVAAIGGFPVIELLLSKGAQTEIADDEGLTAMCWACLKGHFQAVQCLISHAANVNHADNSGRTPLDFAAFNGDPEVVQLLLDSGALMEHVDLAGTRPLDRAIGCKNAAAVVRFLHKGAKLGSQTWNLAQGNAEILVLLLNKMLEDATVLSKRGQLKEATHRYQYALKKFPSDGLLGLDQRFLQIKYQLLLGMSRCRRKLNEPKLAIDAAEHAIVLKPKSFEGFYARGRAREALGLHESALQDITEALRLAPQNSELKRVLLRLKEQISKTRENHCDNNRRESDLGFTGVPWTEPLGSTETLDQLCNMTLNLVEDLTQMKDRMQDSGCESIH